jgi:hypothetical protein
LSYNYAFYILRGKWRVEHPSEPFPGFPLGEPEIAKDAYWAYHYANDVLKGRFPAGEPAIARVPKHAEEYARRVLNLSEKKARRWGVLYLHQQKQKQQQQGSHQPDA